MKISEINIYPVKSLKKISLDRAVVEDRGLENDRRYMLVDENNELVTQREIAALSMVSTRYHENLLEVSLGSENWLSIAEHFDEGKKVEVRVWNSQCEAFLAEENVSDWFSDAFKTKLRLVQMPVSTKRGINKLFNNGDDVVSFADGYPMLIVGENSLRDLNSKLETEIPMDRFRPNLVFSGSDGFIEDKWTKIRVGETVFRVTKPCARCVVTTINQETGVSDDKEPLKTLSKYRKSSDIYPDNFADFGLGKNDVLFGQNLVAENFGREIKVGDGIEVIESN